MEHPSGSDTAIVRSTAALLARDFADEDAVPDFAAALDHEGMRRLLAAHIAWMLEHRLERLMHVFYRLDVPEARVRAILLEAAPEDIPGRLADAVIARELQKVETRRRAAEDAAGINPEAEPLH